MSQGTVEAAAAEQRTWETEKQEVGKGSGYEGQMFETSFIWTS